MTMSRELLINAGAGETRVALVEAGRLEGFWAEPAIGAAAGRLGEIWLARVAKVVPAAPSSQESTSLNGAMAGKIWIADDFDELGPEWDEYIR